MDHQEGNSVRARGGRRCPRNDPEHEPQRQERRRLQPEPIRNENPDRGIGSDDTRAMLDDLIRLMHAKERAAEQPQNREHTQFLKLHQVFLRMNPPSFDGTGGYTAAEAWLEGVREKLQYCRAPEENWVDLTTQLLESHAHYWWNEHKRLYNGDEQRVTWAWFEREFRDRFMGRTQLEALRRQFLELRQRNKAVAEYHEQFYSLLRYAPDVSEDPERLRQQYVEGLDPKLALSVDLVTTNDLNTLMQQDLRAERHIERASLKKFGKSGNQQSENVKLRRGGFIRSIRSGARETLWNM